MKYTILMGSPRREGNTAAVLRPFLEENREMGIEQDIIWLYERQLLPCRGCGACQNAAEEPGCVLRDDFEDIYASVASSEVLVLATPIYAWYCTAPMKVVLDRLIYAGCKYYGQEKRQSSLWMKQVATLTTCGYPPERGADLWEEGLKRCCRHGEMDYLGMYCRQDLGEDKPLLDAEAELDIRDFAHALYIMVGHSL